MWLLGHRLETLSFICLDSVFLCRPGWPSTSNPLISVSWALGLQYSLRSLCQTFAAHWTSLTVKTTCGLWMPVTIISRSENVIGWVVNRVNLWTSRHSLFIWEHHAHPSSDVLQFQRTPPQPSLALRSLFHLATAEVALKQRPRPWVAKLCVSHSMDEVVHQAWPPNMCHLSSTVPGCDF
jgi:hypothetical protein